MVIYKIDIDPMGAPRMVQSDKWKKRPIVLKYFAYRDEIRKHEVLLSETLDIEFHIEMPKSWTMKKKHDYNGKPHQSKPDIDNLIKGFLDTYPEDKTVHSVKAKKVWSKKGQIVLRISRKDSSFQ